MNGKIFQDSANIWQDQAKVLFNYYHQAAKKIVNEEMRIEGQIQQLEQEKAEVELKLSKVWVWLFAFIIPYFIKKKALTQQLESIEARIAEFNRMYGEIFRDYKVTKFGVAYVPVAEQVKYQDKSFIVDYTDTVPEADISMSVSRQNDLLISTVQNLDKLTKEAPIVETNEDTETIQTDEYSLSIQEVKENDYIGAVDRALKTLSFCMDDLETTSVTLPLVMDNSVFLSKLEQFATTTPLQGAPVVEIFDDHKFAPGIKKFEEINDLKATLSNETSQFEEVLRQLMVAIGYSVQTVARMKVESVDKVVMDSNKLLYQILKAPYNHYSQALESEEIERIRNEKFDYSDSIQGYEPFNLKQSSRVRYNPLSGTWVAEDGSQTVQPFGVHQLYEDIVAPVVENLMQENRVERLKIYNHIKDQKLSYLNKWHQDTDSFYRANRAESSDLINLMQQTLTEYVSAYNNLLALKKTENQMADSGGRLDSTVVEMVDNTDETVSAFEIQSQEFQKCQLEFEEYVERLKEDINLKAEKFGHVEYYDGKLRDGYSNSVAVAASEINDMEDRRKTLASINPKLAKDSELLPEPHVSEITLEHFSMNLPGIVKNAMDSLNNVEPENVQEPVADTVESGVEASSTVEEEPAEAPVVEETIEQENVVVPPPFPGEPEAELQEAEDGGMTPPPFPGEELDEEEEDDEDFDEEEEDEDYDDEEEEEEDYDDEEDEDEDFDDEEEEEDDEEDDNE